MFRIRAAIAVAGMIFMSAEAARAAGSSENELKDQKTGEVIIRYAVEAPTVLPQKNRLGLIVCFHGSGGNESSLIGRIRSVLSELRIADDYVVLGAKSRGQGWDAASDGPRVRKLIEWALENYPVDPRRVYSIGHSSGGLMNGSWGVRAQDIFAGVIISTGHYWPITPAENAAETRTEIYLWHGTKDGVHAVQLSRVARDDYRAKGYRYVYREIRGHGHGFGPAEVISDSISWAHALRHKQIPPSPEDAEYLASFSDERSASTLFSRPRTFDELARIGGKAAGEVILKALESPNASVRANAAHVCGRAMFGAEVVEGLGRVLDDRNRKVKELAYEALAIAADWGHAGACQILCRRTLDDSLSVAERGLAVHYIGKVLEREVNGCVRDKGEMVWSLLALGTGSDARLGALGIMHLQKLRPDGPAYDPRLPVGVRQRIVENWSAWAREECGEPAR